MTSSYSPRNPATESSDWVSFSPYGDETTTNISAAANRSKARSKARSSPIASDSNAGPLDEIINDIEQQMAQHDDAMVVMTKQLEDIEVALSDTTRARSSKLAMKNSSSYVSVGEEDGETCETGNHDQDCNNDKPLSTTRKQKHSVIQILQRGSKLKREKENGSFPIATSSPKYKATIAAIPQGPVPRSSQIQAPRNSSSPPPPPPTPPPTPTPPPQVPSQQGSSDAQLKPPTPIGDRAGAALSNLNHDKKGKRFEPSFTWDESVSSQPSIPSNDEKMVSESEEPGEKSSSMFCGSRKAKCYLVLLAAVLLAGIGLLVGQLARQNGGTNNHSKSGSQASPVQQVPQSPVSPVIVPTDANDVATKEDIEESNPTSSTSGQPDRETEGPIQSSPEQENVPSTNVPSTNVVANEQNSDASESGYDYTANTDFLVGVYYYPWHGERFHNGDGYMRKDLIPPHVPALGEYNDSDPGTIAHHMKWFRQANIGLLVTSWWGPNRLEDLNTKDVIMEHNDVGNLKIALHYETSNRLGDGREKIPNAKTDIKYMCENYFDHPNYYKIDGRPVLFIYISRKLFNVGTLDEALLIMRSAASKCGHNLYLIGDVVFESAPDENEPHVPFWYFDAVTNYDVYGSAGRPEGHVGIDGVDNYYRQQADWKERALRDECRYIPAVSPGYNDRGVRFESDHPPLSRRITSTSKEGSLFQYQLKQAKELVDGKVDNMILVNSFNEWHEDTQIEPVIGEPASQPFDYTKGLQYVGYGELYLDILGAATSINTTQHEKYDYLF